MHQQLQNMATMIGGNRMEFSEIVSHACGKVTMSSGSWNAPFLLFDERGFLAKFEHTGKLAFKR